MRVGDREGKLESDKTYLSHDLVSNHLGHFCIACVSCKRRFKILRLSVHATMTIRSKYTVMPYTGTKFGVNEHELLTKLNQLLKTMKCVHLKSILNYKMRAMRTRWNG